MKEFRIILILVFVSAWLSAQDSKNPLSLNGQVVMWSSFHVSDPFIAQPGGRFVPTFTGNFNINKHLHTDFEASANINGNFTFQDGDIQDWTGQIKPYRVWARIYSDKWEVRAGLQKINFGQAKMLRPLMWFDAMDFRDPLQLTDGVYGVLGKYFFDNNADIWAWGLIGNKKPKGWEICGTAQWKPEVGGRFEWPLGDGEIALSANYRKLNLQNLITNPGPDVLLDENKFGLDGKWDLGIGLWFESSTTFTQSNDYNIPTVQDLWNLGADYTFAVGNGIGLTVEYFRYHSGNQFITGGNSLNLIGSLVTYPLTILDNLSGMFFYSPDIGRFFNYVTWSRMYDNLSIYLIGFVNPDDIQMVAYQQADNKLFSGKGVQLMLSYNF